MRYEPKATSRKPPKVYKECAAARGRDLYVYWDRQAQEWVSTIHLGLVPYGVSYTAISPYGYTRTYGPA